MERQICMHAHWCQKRISRQNQAPGMTRDVLQMIHTRGDFLKKARRTKNSEDWGFYKSARSKVVNTIKEAKQKFYETSFEDNKGNSKVFGKQ